MISQKAYFISAISIWPLLYDIWASTGTPTKWYRLKGNQAYIMIPIGGVSHSLIWCVILY